MATKHRLKEALDAIGLHAMAALAGHGHYDDFESKMAMPIHALIADLDKERKGRPKDADKIGALITRVMSGEFDGTLEESEAWAKSKEGQDAFAMLMRGR